MISLPGYTILKQIYIGLNSAIYSAIQLASQKKVVVKYLASENANNKSFSKLKHEFCIASQLNSPFVAKYLELISRP